MKELIRLLNLECDRTLPDNIWMELLSMAEEIKLKKNQTLIQPGDIDGDIYIIKEGIMRGINFDGEKERTTGFGFPGTIFNSRFSFYRREPSCCHLLACCPTTLLRISRDKYLGFTERSHEFALWALHYAWWEQYLEEHRDSNLNSGSPEERYLQILRNRPALAKGVSNRILASYIGITPEHLCRIKARLLRAKQ